MNGGLIIDPKGGKIMTDMKTLLGGVALAAMAQPAAAVIVMSGSGTITTSDLVQTDRVVRDTVASTWASAKTFPGTTTQSTTYYDLINATFAANAVQAIYYEISFTTTDAAAGGVPFSVAYRNSFVPTSLSANYLGDAGFSPAPNATRSY